MGDFEHWIGTRWEARCQMRLPKGGLSVGDTFTYDSACAALKLDPASWLAIGNAVQLDAAPALSETVERKGGKRGGFRFDANPLDAPVPDAVRDAVSAGADVIVPADGLPGGGE